MIAHLAKSAVVGAAGALAVCALVVLDAAWKDRKLRQQALLHDGTYPSWGWSL